MRQVTFAFLSCSVVAGTDPCDAPVYFLEDAAKTKGAVCLDGTPGAYYFSPGSGEGSTKWYIHMQGGGWCLSPSDCAGRSQGDLGSSKGYPASHTAGEMAGQSGAMNCDAKVNPQMHNWNHVWIKYCDGNSFSGDNETTSEVDGVKLHWRGSRILDAAIEDLIEKHGMGSATEVVPGGGSAGGLATFLHCDRWRDRVVAVAPTAKVTCLADCGFFLDCGTECTQTTPKSEEYHNGFLWAYEQQNSSAGVDRTCLAHYGPLGEGWKCNFAQYTSAFNDAPLFARQAIYDSWQTGQILGSTDPAMINTYGADVLRLLQQSLLAQPQHGAFVDSCHHHCAMWGQIKVEGDVVADAFSKWYTNPGDKQLWLQNDTYPCDACCKGGGLAEGLEMVV